MESGNCDLIFPDKALAMEIKATSIMPSAIVKEGGFSGGVGLLMLTL